MRKLIEDRCRELGLTPTDLVRRAGYSNTAKGLRRLQALLNGDLDSTEGLIAKLPEALNLPPEVITQAVEETRSQIDEKEEEAYRANFKPHAIILTEHTIPTQICFALLTGASLHLRIDFDLNQPRSSYSSSAQRTSR